LYTSLNLGIVNCYVVGVQTNLYRQVLLPLSLDGELPYTECTQRPPNDMK